MSKIISTISLPPEIIQSFNKKLLSFPHPHFKDDEKDIFKILLYVHKKLWHKLDKCPSKKKECEKLIKEIRFYYEQIKKEKNKKTTSENLTERPFYHLECTKRSHTEILQRYVRKCRYTLP